MTKNEMKSFITLNAKGDVSEEILDYIASNIGSVPFISLQQLAMETHSSISEITDFLNTLGFNDFIEFKTYLRKTNYFERKGDQLVERDLRNIASDMMNCELQNLTEFFGNFDYELLDRLVQDITAASEVVFLAFRGSTAYTSYAVNMFNKIGIRASFLNLRDVNFTDYLNTMSRSILLISFGFARYNKSLVVANNVLKKNGFHIVGITDSIHSPLAALADYSFVLPVHSVDFSDSFTAGMLLINLITFKIGLTNKDNMLKSIASYEHLSNELDAFY